tara:strand:+ start:437 stop:643 length:207 start_codon:yes stop_codon:yes gene_type:complete
MMSNSRSPDSTETVIERPVALFEIPLVPVVNDSLLSENWQPLIVAPVTFPNGIKLMIEFGSVSMLVGV